MRTANVGFKQTLHVLRTNNHIKAGKRNSRNLVLRGQSVGFESEPKLSSNSMESEKEFPDLNQSLYPNIEPMLRKEIFDKRISSLLKYMNRDDEDSITQKLNHLILSGAQKPIENDATRDNLGTNSTANETIVQEKLLLLFLDVTGGWKSDYLFEVSTD